MSVKFFAKTSNSARAVALDAQTLESAKAEAWDCVLEQHVGVIVFVVHDTGEREVVAECSPIAGWV